MGLAKKQQKKYHLGRTTLTIMKSGTLEAPNVFPLVELEIRGSANIFFQSRYKTRLPSSTRKTDSSEVEATIQ